MAQGAYSPEERRKVEEAARLVVSGEKSLQDAVQEVAESLGRSPQGVKLYLGRTVRRLNGTGGRRRMRGQDGRRLARGRRSLERLVSATKERAMELRRLREQREKLSRRIQVLEDELKELQNELLRNIGLGDDEVEEETAQDVVQ
jgi:predicted transcriptional regulator